MLSVMLSVLNKATQNMPPVSKQENQQHNRIMLSELAKCNVSFAITFDYDLEQILQVIALNVARYKRRESTFKLVAFCSLFDLHGFGVFTKVLKMSCT